MGREGGRGGGGHKGDARAIKEEEWVGVGGGGRERVSTGDGISKEQWVQMLRTGVAKKVKDRWVKILTSKER